MSGSKIAPLPVVVAAVVIVSGAGAMSGSIPEPGDEEAAFST